MFARTLQTSARRFSTTAAPDPAGGGGLTPVLALLVAGGGGAFVYLNQEWVGLKPPAFNPAAADIKKAHEGAWGGQGARAAAANARGQETHAVIQRRLTKR